MIIRQKFLRAATDREVRALPPGLPGLRRAFIMTRGISALAAGLALAATLRRGLAQCAECLLAGCITGRHYRQCDGGGPREIGVGAGHGDAEPGIVVRETQMHRAEIAMSKRERDRVGLGCFAGCDQPVDQCGEIVWTRQGGWLDERGGLRLSRRYRGWRCSRSGQYLCHSGKLGIGTDRRTRCQGVGGLQEPRYRDRQSRRGNGGPLLRELDCSLGLWRQCGLGAAAGLWRQARRDRKSRCHRRAWTDRRCRRLGPDQNAWQARRYRRRFFSSRTGGRRGGRQHRRRSGRRNGGRRLGERGGGFGRGRICRHGHGDGRRGLNKQRWREGGERISSARCLGGLLRLGRRGFGLVPRGNGPARCRGVRRAAAAGRAAGRAGRTVGGCTAGSGGCAGGKILPLSGKGAARVAGRAEGGAGSCGGTIEASVCGGAATASSSDGALRARKAPKSALSGPAPGDGGSAPPGSDVAVGRARMEGWIIGGSCSKGRAGYSSRTVPTARRAPSACGVWAWAMARA